MNDAMNRTVVRMRDFRPQVTQGVRSLRAGARSAAYGLDDFVRDNPWAAIGIAVAAGILAGAATGAARVWRARDTRADDVYAATSG